MLKYNIIRKKLHTQEKQVEFIVDNKKFVLTFSGRRGMYNCAKIYGKDGDDYIVSYNDNYYYDYTASEVIKRMLDQAMRGEFTLLKDGQVFGTSKMMF